MLYATVAYTNHDTGARGRVSVDMDLLGAPARAPSCPGFTFGSASHPDDFRCQTCGHFAWSGHAPKAAWHGASDAPRHLAVEAIEKALTGMRISADMVTTLRAWAHELLNERPRPLVAADLAAADRFLVRFGA
jgi:hypothetical protein